MSLLPLITIQKDSPRYQVSFDAIKFLKTLKEKKVLIVCNFDFENSKSKQLISQKLLKNTVPTKLSLPGIGIWNQTLSISPEIELVLLETDGLESCDESNLSSIFSICSILASVVLVHGNGDLEEKILPKLKFLTSIPEKTQTKSFGCDICFIQQGVSMEFPSKAQSEEFVFNCLKIKEKDPENIKTLKRTIHEGFKEKYQVGVSIDKNADNLKTYLQGKNNNFKSCESKTLNGPLIFKIAYEATEFLKKGAKINVGEALEQAFSSEAKEVLEDLKKDFQTKLRAELSEAESPYDMDEVEKIFKLGIHDFSGTLDNKLKGICDLEKYIELRNEFFEMYDREVETFTELNKKQSKDFCDEILNKFFSNVSISEITTSEQIKPTLIREFEEEFTKLMEIYMNNARGPAKLQCLLDNLVSFLFQKFQRVYEGLCNVFTQENNKTRLSLLQMKEERDKLQISIKELESLRFEAEQMKENIARESESLKREFDYQLLSKDYNEESLKNSLESKDKLIKKKKEQKKTLKTENTKFRENELKLKHEINLVLNEVMNLKRKNKELERILEEQLFSISRELKGQTQNVEDLLQKKPGNDRREAISAIQTTSSANFDEIEEELKHKQLEIEKLKKEKKALKEELNTKVDQESRRFNKLKDSLNREIEKLKQEKEEMNKKIISFDSRDQEIKNLMCENTKKDQSLEFYMNLLELNKQQIESIVCEIADIKQQNGDLKQFKDSIPFILSEGLRYAMKQTKSSKISVSLRTMKDEDAKLILSVFDEVGLHLKF